MTDAQRIWLREWDEEIDEAYKQNAKDGKVTHGKNDLLSAFGQRDHVHQSADPAGWSVTRLYRDVLGLARPERNLHRYYWIIAGLLVASLVLGGAAGGAVSGIDFRADPEFAQDHDRHRRYLRLHRASAPRTSDHELGALVDGFNDMLQQIQQRDMEVATTPGWK